MKNNEVTIIEQVDDTTTIIEINDLGGLSVQGIQGPVGPQGLQGATGPQGPAGPQGEQGQRGIQGLQGIQGAAGPTGATGPAGPTGPQGLEGDRGQQGQQGIQGPQGNIGRGVPTGGLGGQVLVRVDGPDYETIWTDFPTYEIGISSVPVSGFNSAGEEEGLGVDRIAFADDFVVSFAMVDDEYVGTVELRGGAGGTGADGKSAYEIAVESGFVGTQAEWLASLVGPDGADGTNGVDGLQGPKGDTGSTGLQGPSGVAGSDGADGADGDVGPQGPQGEIGPQGPKGDTGAAGSPGASTWGAITGTLSSQTDLQTAINTKASLTGAAFTGAVSSTGTVTGTNIVSGFVLSCCGKPTASEIVGVAEAPYAFTATATNCTAKASIAATASAVFTIRKGATTVGTFTFAAGATTATKSITSGAIAKGDLITITAPATADATLANISFTVRA